MTEYIYGIHAAMALIERQPECVKTVFFHNAGSKRLAAIIESAISFGIATQKVNPPQLDRLAGASTHQGIVLAVTPFVLKTEADLKGALEKMPEKATFLVLEQIQDPHNLGACIRTAEAFGVTGVIFPKSKSVGLTAAVRKVACGAEMGVALYQVTNLVRSLELLKSAGVWVIGTDLAAKKPVWGFDMRQHIAIVMGNEETGIRVLTRDHCDDWVTIPLTGMTQSLNVSVATGICLHEIARQRLA